MCLATFLAEKKHIKDNKENIFRIKPLENYDEIPKPTSKKKPLATTCTYTLPRNG